MSANIVIVVSEDCHGVLCAADSVKSAMKFLITDGWVHENVDLLTEPPAKQEIKEYCPRCGKFINPVFKVRQISQRVFTNSDTYKTIAFEGLAAECPECREELISGFVEARNKAEFDRKKEESL